MKQSTLNFAATKRTASSSTFGKPKASYPTAKPLRSPRKSESEKLDSNDEQSDRYDDNVLKESREEEVAVEVIKDTPDSRTNLEVKPEVDSSSAEETMRKTRSQIKMASSLPATKSTKVQDPDSPSPRPFKTNNLKPEDHQKKVEVTDVHHLSELDPTSRKWNKQYAAAKAKMGGFPASLFFCFLLRFERLFQIILPLFFSSTSGK